MVGCYNCTMRLLALATLLLTGCASAPPPCPTTAEAETSEAVAASLAQANMADPATQPPAAASAATLRWPEDAHQRLRVPVADGVALGPDDALVTIVEFGDYQCPFCGRVQPTLERLRRRFGDDVRLVFRHNPLPFHDKAGPAAQLALEARAVGGVAGFWQMHHLLFANQRALERADLERYAAQVGLDPAQAMAAIDQDRHLGVITADQAVAARVGARGTPAFFINGRSLVGAQPYERFEAMILEELESAREAMRRGTPRARLYEAAMAVARDEPPPAPAAAAPPARRRSDPDARYRVVLSGDEPARGSPRALVTLVIYTDFQCPFCSRVLPTLREVERLYGSDVRMVFRNNPLPFHQNAKLAAEAALEVHAQRGDVAFWQYHDLLFADQRNLERPNLEALAGQLRGLDMSRFRRALDQHTHAERIDREQADAVRLGARGTPGFFINGVRLMGAQPIARFQTVIDAELARARQLVAGGANRRRIYEAAIEGGASDEVFLPGAAPTPNPSAPTPQVYQLSVPANAPTRGPVNAPVTIQLFSDFQCPFCNRVRPVIERIVREYPNRVRVVWRNYPLSFHPRARPAANAAWEVYSQAGSDAFWRYHDQLFDNQRQLTDANLETWASQLGGIDMGRFRSAMSQNAHDATIQADMDAVGSAGARIGTPSFFINGTLLQGARPFESFQEAIEAALNP